MKQILRLHREDILLLLVLLILWKVFSLTAKISPTNPNILMYDRVIIYMALKYIIILIVY